MNVGGGHWKQGVGYRILDAGSRMQVTGCWMVMADVGCRCWTHGVGYRILIVDAGLSDVILDSGSFGCRA